MMNDISILSRTENTPSVIKPSAGCAKDLHRKVLRTANLAPSPLGADLNKKQRNSCFSYFF